MNNKRDKIQSAAPLHSDYWKEKNLVDYKGGPFSDFSGGCITFACESFESARDLVNEDPFVVSNCLEKYWLKEWVSNIN